MSEEEVSPTFIGRNKELVFVVPKELFNLNISSDQVVDRETAKLFSTYLKGTFKGFEEARKTKLGNKNNTKMEVSPEFWDQFEKKAKAMGVDFIGYTPVIENFVFYDLKVFGKNAIVLGMEMKWEKIKTAPSVYAEMEAFRVYKELGEVTIELTNYLKSQGYKSEAHHPFGGKLLFGPHAVAAGLGILGKNGLIITPEFGPRQRWSIITTDAVISNKPKRDFSELIASCEKCGGACVRGCKGGSVYERPIKKSSGIITHIDRSKCIQSITKNNYCSLCLKICPQGKKV